jgi:hypothetical protein
MRAAPSAPPKGHWAQCGPNLNDEDPKNDPSQADKEWGQEREIRAEVIRWLAVDEKAKHEVDPKGIWVYGAKITGKLDLSFVTIPFPMVLWHCRLMDDAELHDAQLPILDLRGSWVRAINAERLDIKGEVFLSDGFHAEGEVLLPGAQIGSNLRCDGGTFVNPYGKALVADHAHVQGYVFLRNGFRAEGTVVLVRAQVGANVECDGGTFAKPKRKASEGDGINVYEVKPWDKALDADGINVHGALFLRQGFRAEGVVWLLGAQIGGDLDCVYSEFTEITAESATVRGNVYWWGLKNAENATLDLTQASAGSVGDDWDERNWPKHLVLDGLVYRQISAGPTDAKTRLRWLARQDAFAPQPYRQLAKVLRERGDEDGAVTVLEEMERLRRKQEDHNPVAQAWSSLFRVTIGYGYNPAWAIYEILGLSAIGWIIYRRSYLAGGITPTEKDAYESFKYKGQPPPHYTAFAPLVFSVENSLPLVKLGQEDTWHPEPDRESALSQRSNWPTCLATSRTWTHFQGLQRRLILWGVQRDPNPKKELPRLQRFLVYCGLQPPPDREAARSRLSRWLTSPRFVRWFLWVHILLGWLLATLFLAGLTGIIRKD